MTKSGFISVALVLWSLASAAQEIPVEEEQQFENLTEVNEAETEDDSYVQQLVVYKKHPLNLNTAGDDDLRDLGLLTDLQIINFLRYRKLLGRLISIYELQAVPGWDVYTIKKIVPFVRIGDAVTISEHIRERLRGGDHSLLLRYSQLLEKPVGYTPKPGGSYYLGGRQKLFFRYRYQYKTNFQYGLTGDKDAGEQFFRGPQRAGFDFYSFHLFARNIGKIKALALGDFTVNLGQGLIQWQRLAFKKGGNTMAIKRQSPVLRPYTSAGEYNFHRGIGATIQTGNLAATAFLSYRKISANFVNDTLNQPAYFSSFLVSGYHRTASELEDRNNLGEFSYGGNLSWQNSKFHAGLNMIGYRFSLPLLKRQEPYNLYAISGSNWQNFSIDYSYTFKNVHVFGEAAVDKYFHKAMINGLLASVDPKVDLSLLCRSISKRFQSLNGNAFTETAYPSNEQGIYLGISIRPATAWQLDGYADLYRFPWLKYLVDAPSFGKDFLVQVTYQPDRKTRIYSRFRAETKQANLPGNSNITNSVIPLAKQNWRTELFSQLTEQLSLRNRIELLWYGGKDGISRETGFLAYGDLTYSPVNKPYSANMRVQYFETGSYASRIYAFERDVLYGYSIPVFYDKGFRYYVNVKWRPSPSVSCWFRWAGTVYQGKNVIGSGLDEIEGSSKNELKIQLLVYL
ncbi:MAG TPA: hypothetical protein VFS36_02060 [Chitinophagaceae bacterium]|nr:hypothetical protein [Chitinophagaceae bacterium]